MVPGRRAPGRPVPQVACAFEVGLTWQVPQSAVTSLVPVGAPADQATASCFISPEAGVRAGLVAVGPTKPVGTEPAWQSPQVAGAGCARLASEEWSRPG